MNRYIIYYQRGKYMIYTDMVKLAMEICLDAHSGQVDKGGYPYVFHPIHIAEQMDTEHEIVVALLHDVLEMSRYTVQDLVDAGFSQDVILSLMFITRISDDPYIRTYQEYIENIKQDDVARKVKLADLKHNLDTSRLHCCELDESMIKRYSKAIEILKY